MAAVSPAAQGPIELRLLLAIARRFVGSDQDATIENLLTRPLDWQVLLSVARWHKLDVLLARTPELAVTPIAAQLEEIARARALQALTLTATLVRLQDRLNSAGIPFLQIKGLSVAHMAYGDLALRPSLDLDLILKPEDVDRALALFAEAGFVSYEQEPALLQRMRTRLDCQTGLTDRAASLDVHWTFSLFPEMFPLSAARALERSARLTIGGHHIPVPNNDDLLCFLCFHGAKHLWTRLFWIMDIALMTRNGYFGPGLPEQTIRDLNQMLPVTQAYLLAQKLFDTPLPPQVDQWRQQYPQTEHQVGHVLKLLFGGPLQAEDYGISIALGRKMLWESRLYARKTTGWKILARYLFQPASTDLRSLALPPLLFPLYYLLRPARLVLRELFRKVRD